MWGVALSVMVLAHAGDMIKTHTRNLVTVVSTLQHISDFPHQPRDTTSSFGQKKIVM